MSYIQNNSGIRPSKYLLSITTRFHRSLGLTGDCFIASLQEKEIVNHREFFRSRKQAVEVPIYVFLCLECQCFYSIVFVYQREDHLL